MKETLTLILLTFTAVNMVLVSMVAVAYILRRKNKVDYGYGVAHSEGQSECRGEELSLNNISHLGVEVRNEWRRIEMDDLIGTIE